MVESDYLSEGAYTSFSKGPKSVYRWRGEPNLPSLILNLPQTDEGGCLVIYTTYPTNCKAARERQSLFHYQKSKEI